MIADFVHSDGASVDLDNAFLLIVKCQAVISCRLIPRWSRCRRSFYDNDAGKSRETSAFRALVGMKYGTYHSCRCSSSLTKRQEQAYSQVIVTFSACATIFSAQMPSSDVLSGVRTSHTPLSHSR